MICPPPLLQPGPAPPLLQTALMMSMLVSVIIFGPSPTRQQPRCSLVRCRRCKNESTTRCYRCGYLYLRCCTMTTVTPSAAAVSWPSALASAPACQPPQPPTDPAPQLQDNVIILNGFLSVGAGTRTVFTTDAVAAPWQPAPDLPMKLSSGSGISSARARLLRQWCSREYYMRNPGGVSYGQGDPAAAAPGAPAVLSIGFAAWQVLDYTSVSWESPSVCDFGGCL